MFILYNCLLPIVDGVKKSMVLCWNETTQVTVTMIIVVVLVVALLTGVCTAILIVTYVIGTKKIIKEMKHSYHVTLNVPKAQKQMIIRKMLQTQEEEDEGVITVD
jgi:sensor histidine kinase YesM